MTMIHPARKIDGTAKINPPGETKPRKVNADKFAGALARKQESESLPLLDPAQKQQIQNALNTSPPNYQRVCSYICDSIRNMDVQTADLMRRLSAGKLDTLSAVRLQGELYQMNQNVQFVLKIVEQLVSGVKTTLQTQI